MRASFFARNQEEPSYVEAYDRALFESGGAGCSGGDWIVGFQPRHGPGARLLRAKFAARFVLQLLCAAGGVSVHRRSRRRRDVSVSTANAALGWPDIYHVSTARSARVFIPASPLVLPR